MKLNLILTILFLTLVSCNNKTEKTFENEKKLLEKELELTKRELEIEKKEKGEINKEDNQTIASNEIKSIEFNYEKPEQVVEAIIYEIGRASCRERV